MKKSITILFMLTSILSSCSDNEEAISIDLNKTYHSTHIEAGDIKMFTINGEIKDQTLLKSAISELYNSFSIRNYYIEEDKIIDQNEADLLELKNNMAIFNSSEKFDYSISNDLLTFTNQKPDTVIWSELSKYLSIHTPTYVELESNPNLSKLKLKIHLDKNEEKYTRIIPSKIVFPQLIYFYSTKNFAVVNLNYNNEFNENVYQYFDKGDTLLIQINKLIFE